MTVLHRVALEEMLLQRDVPIGAGSRMLAQCPSLFDGAVAERLRADAEITLLRAECGEFSIDLLGETAFGGRRVRDRGLVSHAAELLLDGAADAAVSLDVNGAPRRSAAQRGLVCIKPTYGSISRYGAVSAVPSGETVALTARSSRDCRALLSRLAAHDVRDGTSLSETACARVREDGACARRVAIPEELLAGIDGETSARMDTAAERLRACGTQVSFVSTQTLSAAHAAWNTVLCAELCKGTARYDGVRFGHRAKGCQTLDELYSRSRGEGFGVLLKCAILYGSDVLSPENFGDVYCRALRVRTAVRDCLTALLSEYDALLTPACSVGRYREEIGEFAPFEENFYTAPASLTGLPAVVAGGVQLIGDFFSDGMLLSTAEAVAEGGRA